MKLQATIVIWLFVIVSELGLTSPTSSASAEETIDVFFELIDQVKVPAREAGILTKVLVKEGKIVKKGDVLATIDETEAVFKRNDIALQLKAAKEQAANDVDVQAAQKAADLAEHHWKRVQRTRAKNPDAFSETEAEERKLEFDEKTLAIEQARLKQRIAKITVEQKEGELKFATGKPNAAKSSRRCREWSLKSRNYKASGSSPAMKSFTSSTSNAYKRKVTSKPVAFVLTGKGTPLKFIFNLARERLKSSLARLRSSAH